MSSLDVLVKGVQVVRPDRAQPELLDIGIKDGKFTRLEAGIDPAGSENEARRIAERPRSSRRNAGQGSRAPRRQGRQAQRNSDAQAEGKSGRGARQ